MDDRKNIKLVLNIAFLLVICILLWWGQHNLSAFYIRILNLSAVFVVLGISMNLVLGFTGMFSLGHSGFMCIGAYVAAILTMSPASKEIIYFMEPIIPMLANVQWPVFPAIVAAGIVAAIFGFLIGIPALRLRDDYLALGIR